MHILRKKVLIFTVLLIVLPITSLVDCKASLSSDLSSNAILNQDKEFTTNASDLNASSQNSKFEDNFEPFQYVTEVEIGEAGCTVGAAVYKSGGSISIYTVLHENSFENATVFVDTPTIRKYAKIEHKRTITPQLRDTCNGSISVTEELDAYSIQLMQNQRQRSDLELNVQNFWSFFR